MAPCPQAALYTPQRSSPQGLGTSKPTTLFRVPPDPVCHPRGGIMIVVELTRVYEMINDENGQSSSPPSSSGPGTQGRAADVSQSAQNAPPTALRAVLMEER